jgi:hypothetical protein
LKRKYIRRECVCFSYIMSRGGRDRGGERESEKETENRQPFSRIRFLIYRILK